MKAIFGTDKHLIEIQNKQIDSLIKEIKSLKSQLANIKYLNADDVRAIYDKLFITMGVNDFIQAICKLAIPDIDRNKIIEVLKAIQKTYGKCFDLIEEEELAMIADQIIKAIRGEE